MENRTHFEQLFAEFQQDYLAADGLTELANYIEIRNAAYDNVQQIQECMARGENCTDLILRKLLPYSNTTNNRWLGAWTHLAAAVPGDIRRWYGAAGRTGQEDWPIVANAIWRFVNHVLSSPDQLPVACAQFSELPVTKGFQTGMLTPILNALEPDYFYIVNNRTRGVLHYFTGKNYSSALTNFPQINQAVDEFLIDFGLVNIASDLGVKPGDIFERFCYWVGAARRYTLRPPRYWLIAVGEDSWHWEEWKDGGFAALGWDELGNLSNIKKSEFVDRRDSLMAQYSYWTKRDTDVVWRFARQLKEGDQIVAIADDVTMLGFGTIIGDYYHVSELPQSHRVPVMWEDIQLREYGGTKPAKCMQELSAEQFETMQQSPVCDELTIASSVEGKEPQFVDYFGPLLQLLRTQENGASIAHLIDLLLQAKDRQTSSKSERLIHRARYYLSKARLIESPHLGQWRVTAYGDAISLDRAEMVRIYQEVEYRQRVEESLLHESNIIRQLTESSVDYSIGEPPKQPHEDHLLGGDNTEKILAASPKAHDSQLEQQESLYAASDPYPIAQCASQTGFGVANLNRWVRTLMRKRQVIIYGPSGTGKTFLAHHLARHLVGGSDGLCELVQFHPAYAYEDFVQGFRPSAATTEQDGQSTQFVMQPGRFLEFCNRARVVGGPAVLIIDEINRANLARVFGEIMYLMENREAEAILAGNGMRFQIPQNVYLIGTMNLADRSVSLLDHALRRRFGFIELVPDYDVLRHYHNYHQTGVNVEPLIRLLVQINHAIGRPHHALGIAYFLIPTLYTDLQDVWQMEIEPTLQERFFDSPEEIEKFRWQAVAKMLEEPQGNRSSEQ